MKVICCISILVILVDLFRPDPLIVSANYSLPQESISCDTSLEDSLGAGEVKCYSYLAEAGDVINVRAIGRNGLQLKIELLDPAGDPITSKTASGDNKVVSLDTITLAKDGSYTIRIADPDDRAGDFGISFQCVNNCDKLEEVAYGSTTFGMIGSIGQMKAFRFLGMPGQAVHISLGQASAIWPRLELYAPDGQLMKSQYLGSNQWAIRIDTLLNKAGYYTILVMDRDGDEVDPDHPFALSLQWINDPGRDILPPDTNVCAGVSYFGQTLAYSFLAAAGDQLTLRMGEKSVVTPRLEFYDPQGHRITQRVGSAGSATRIDYTLDISGVYSVFVMDKDGSKIDPNVAFGLSIQKRNGQIAQILEDTVIQDFFTKYGQIDSYTFWGKEKESIHITLQGKSPYKAQLEVYDPSGLILAENTAGNSAGAASVDVRIGKTGVHTIFVMDEQGNDISLEDPYTLTISGIGAAVSLTYSPMLCREDAFVLQGEVFDIDRHSGTVSWPAGNIGAPDTVANILLSFYPEPVAFIRDTLCLGEDTLIGGQVFNQTHYVDTLLLENAGFYGCDSIIFVALEFDLGCQVDQQELILPKVFTPNQDGLNDEFVIPLLSVAPAQYSGTRLVIYNRWKRKVYESANYENGNWWDGRDLYTGEWLPAGTYYYVFIPGGRNSTTHTGMATIMR